MGLNYGQWPNKSTRQNLPQVFDIACSGLCWRPLRIFNQTVDDPAGRPDTGTMTARLDTVFSALADPTRRAILAMLLEDDMAVTDVAAPFQMSLAAISKHLAILAEAGLIAQEKRGRINWCKLEPDAMRDAFTWMQSFGQFQPLDLDAFERFIAAELTADIPD
jgi:DNA-binding transcriptional ArsR family regulator